MYKCHYPTRIDGWMRKQERIQRIGDFFRTV